MRLNGKRQIMEYLGRQATNWRVWQAIQLRYGRVIWLRRSRQLRYWTRQQWLSRVDMGAGRTVYDAEHEGLVQRVTAQRRVYEETLKRLHERRSEGA